MVKIYSIRDLPDMYLDMMESYWHNELGSLAEKPHDDHGILTIWNSCLIGEWLLGMFVRADQFNQDVVDGLFDWITKLPKCKAVNGMAIEAQKTRNIRPDEKTIREVGRLIAVGSSSVYLCSDLGGPGIDALIPEAIWLSLFIAMYCLDEMHWAELPESEQTGAKAKFQKDLAEAMKALIPKPTWTRNSMTLPKQ